MTKPKNWKRIIFLAVIFLLLLFLIFYVYTYYFASKEGKVIYQDSQRRIYLVEKPREYKKGRLMWRLVLEDMKTGKRFFIFGNTKVSAKESDISKRIINTVNKGEKSSFDQVAGIGVTVREAKTDVHSNLIGKKSLSEIVDLEGMQKDFTGFNNMF